MRFLVVGTVPPPGGEAAMRLAAVVRDVLADGDTAEVVSPDVRSASHRHARLDGVRLAIDLARSAQRFDAVVLDFAPGIPLPADASRLARALTLASLGAALCRYDQVILRLPSPIPIPWGVGGRPTRQLWSNATSIVVENEHDRDRVLVAPGVVADRIKVEMPAVPQLVDPDDDWGRLLVYDGDLRARAQVLVRERADRDRELLGGRSVLDESNAPPPVENPFEGAAGLETGLSKRDLANLARGRARHIAFKILRAVR